MFANCNVKSNGFRKQRSFECPHFVEGRENHTEPICMFKSMKIAPLRNMICSTPSSALSTGNQRWKVVLEGRLRHDQPSTVCGSRFGPPSALSAWRLQSEKPARQFDAARQRDNDPHHGWRLLSTVSALERVSGLQFVWLLWRIIVDMSWRICR